MAKAETRQLIISTAAELFYQKGYNLVGINEIIAQAGIAKATLYSHFKSKEDLCTAYLEEKDTNLITALKAFLDTKRKGENRIVAILEFLLNFYNSKDFRGCWCIRTHAEISNNSQVTQQIRDNKANLLRLIETEVQFNLDNLVQPKRIELSRTIYLLYEAAVMESFLLSDAWPIEHSILILKKSLKDL